MRFKEVKLEELCSIQRGASPRPIKDYVVEEGIPWVKIADATSDNSRYIFKTKEFIKEEGKNKSRPVFKGDLILSNSATPGLPKIMEIDACIHDGWLLLRDFKDISKEYLYYLLVNERRKLVSNATGTVFNNLKTETVKNFKVKIPVYEQEQQKITAFLESLDNKIDLNTNIISNLKELSQTLFKRWFVDFEYPDENGKPYKSNGGKMVESELGMMPEGWEIVKLNEVANHSKKTFNPVKEKKIDVAHFSFPAYDSMVYPIIENSKSIKSNKYLIDKYSLMFSRMNPNTPRTWLPNIIDNYINVCSSEYVVLDTQKNDNKAFIYSLISSNSFNNFLVNNATGSTNSRQRVRPETAMNYEFPYYERKILEFQTIVEGMYNKILCLREQMNNLANLRDSLLPKLLSGEIELPDTKEVTEDVPIS